MIGYQQKQIWLSQKFLLPKAHSFKDLFCCFWNSKLVFVARLAIYRDEIDFFVRVHPKGNVMGKALAWTILHAWQIRRSL